jgi:hypothetical protein
VDEAYCVKADIAGTTTNAGTPYRQMVELSLFQHRLNPKSLPTARNIMLLRPKIPVQVFHRHMELLCPSSKHGIQPLEVKLITRNCALGHLLTS